MASTSILSSIPASKRAYFVKKRTTRPSGFGRYMPIVLDKPWHCALRRPVGHLGRKHGFFGTKAKSFCGPFTGDEGKTKAGQIAQSGNVHFHASFH